MSAFENAIVFCEPGAPLNLRITSGTWNGKAWARNIMITMPGWLDEARMSVLLDPTSDPSLRLRTEKGRAFVWRP